MVMKMMLSYSTFKAAMLAYFIDLGWVVQKLVNFNPGLS